MGRIRFIEKLDTYTALEENSDVEMDSRQAEIDQIAKKTIKIGWDWNLSKIVATIMMFCISFLMPAYIGSNWEQIVSPRTLPFASNTVNLNNPQINTNQTNPTEISMNIQENNSSVLGIDTNKESNTIAEILGQRISDNLGLILIVIGLGFLATSGVIYLRLVNAL